RYSGCPLGDGRERIASVANFDTSAVRARGVFREVVGYDEDIRGPLLDALQRLDPRVIGLNYSTDDVTADGLTHGHWLLLNDLLRDTPYSARLTSAAPLLSRLRGRKSPAEVERIRRAIVVTEEVVGWLTPQIRPGRSEGQIADVGQHEFRRRGLAPAWGWETCPVVNSGPASEVGHSGPREDIRVEPGHLIHLDLGVRRDGFCSDLQRMWYVRRPGE